MLTWLTTPRDQLSRIGPVAYIYPHQSSHVFATSSPFYRELFNSASTRHSMSRLPTGAICQSAYFKHILRSSYRHARPIFGTDVIPCPSDPKLTNGLSIVRVAPAKTMPSAIFCGRQHHQETKYWACDKSGVAPCHDDAFTQPKNTLRRWLLWADFAPFFLLFPVVKAIEQQECDKTARQKSRRMIPTAWGGRCVA